MYEDFTLLVDGNNSFKTIIECINNAKEYIKINMFIWRDDKIGNEVARAVLEAANRGVKVEIVKDRYGVVLEKAEEAKLSFFHKKQNFFEIVKSIYLESAYKLKADTKIGKDKYSDLYNEIMSHKNIKVSKDEFRADHSKYYIIDDTLIMGGVNIEDKENGKDKQGRVYQDYMIMLKGKEYVESFKKKLLEKVNVSEDYFFGVNIKNRNKKELFEMHDLYLEMIKDAKETLTITMAYFSPLNEFVEEIVKASKRGVNVNIMIPSNANFQDDSNKRTVRMLMKLTDNKINVYLSKKMVHTKMIINDEYISFGSTNITKKAFNQLDELNIFIKNKDSVLRDTLFKSIKENYNEAVKVSDYKNIKYNELNARIEGLLV